MASFTYKAIDHNGETENGYLIAENIEEAQNELKNRILIRLKLKKSNTRFLFIDRLFKIVINFKTIIYFNQ